MIITYADVCISALIASATMVVECVMMTTKIMNLGLGMLKRLSADCVTTNRILSNAVTFVIYVLGVTFVLNVN